VKHVFLFITLLFFGLGSRAQSDTIFQYTFGGIQNDICNQVKVTKDKGYIMIGTTNSFCDDGGTNFYAVKVDSVGRYQWSKTYGGNESDEGYSVEQTLDSGYAFLGWTNSYGAGGYDVLLVKTDASGNMLWQKTYGGADWDFGYSIRQTADSGFVICGQTYSYGAGNGDVYVIRTDKNGDTLWTRAIGDSGYDIGNSVYVQKDSIYIIAGATTSFGAVDTTMFLIKMNNKGTVEFDTIYGGLHNTTVARSVEGVPGGGYVIAGYTDSLPNGDNNANDYTLIIQTDSMFRMKTPQQWAMQLFYSKGIGYCNDALQCPDGYTVAAATSNSDGLGGYAMLIVRTGGPFLSAGPFEGGTGDEEGNSCAYNHYNNNVVFAGVSNSTGTTDTTNFTQGLFDFYLVRYNEDTDIILDYKCAHKLVRFRDSVPCVTSVQEQGSGHITAKAFPDPVTAQATIIVQDEMDGKCMFSLYNMMGQCVISNTEMKPAGHEQLITHFAKGNLQAGEYIYKIRASDNKTATGKIIVE